MHQERCDRAKRGILSIQCRSGFQAHGHLGGRQVCQGSFSAAADDGWRCVDLRYKSKGNPVIVWTFMGNSRMDQALRYYGDRIETIGLFSFKVDATGAITEGGASISNMLTYSEKWPHIRWL